MGAWLSDVDVGTQLVLYTCVIHFLWRRVVQNPQDKQASQVWTLQNTSTSQVTLASLLEGEVLIDAWTTR